MATEKDTFGVRNTTIPSILANNWFARVFGIVMMLIVWSAIASVFPNQLMPYPIETVQYMVELVEGGALEHVGITMWRTLWGFLIAWGLGIVTGVVMGVSWFGERFTIPYIIVGLSIPAVSMAAITTLIFGFGNIAPIVATAIVTFPYITLDVWKGVEDINPDLVRMSQAFEVPRTQILRRFILLSIAPALFSGFRFALAIAWKIVTIAEMFASSNGIGYNIVTAYTSYHYEQAFAWAVLFMVIVLAIEYGFARPLERRAFKYRTSDDVRDLM